MIKIKIAPSVAVANFWNLSKDIKEMKKAKVDLLHFDVMDGVFVRNFTLGHDILRTLSKKTSIPIDVHLAINDPDIHIEEFAKSGAKVITVHVETSKHLHLTVEKIKKLGIKAGVSLNPTTSLDILEYIIEDADKFLIMTVDPGFASQSFIPSMVSKIKKLRDILEERNLATDIEVDGAVNLNTVPKTAVAGANVFVLGTSSIFRKGVNVIEGIKAIRKCASKNFRKK